MKTPDLQPIILKDLKRFFKKAGVKYTILHSNCIYTATGQKFPALSFRVDTSTNYTSISTIPHSSISLAVHCATAAQLIKKLEKFKFLQLDGGRLLPVEY